MKNSGIEWIGVIPDDWEVMRLQFCLDEIIVKNDPIQTTQVLSLMKDKGVMLYEEKGDIGNKAKDDCSEYKIAYPNTLIVNSMNILIGSVGISNYFGCVSPVYYVFAETSFSDLRFVNYIFNTTAFQKELRRYAKGILEIRLRVSASDIFKREIPLPKKLTQQKIADFLDDKCAKIDGLISHEEATIEELKAYKQSVITEAVTKGLDKTVPMKDSGVKLIGEIPYTWQICKLSNVCQIITDFVASGSFADLKENVKYVDEPDYAMLVRTTDLSGSNRSEKKVYISEEAYKFLKNSNLFGGEIVLPNIGASCGDVYIVPKLYKYMSLAPNAIMLKTKFNDKFYFYFFKSKCGRELLLDLCASTAQQKFNKTELRLLLVPILPQGEQNNIVLYLDKKCAEIDKLISIKQQKIEELKEYKKSLIYEYVTGKKEVC